MDNPGHMAVYRYTNKAVEIRNYATEAERTLADKSLAIKFPHLRPNSVCVIAIGYNWQPGAWEKVVEMVKYTNEQGTCCWLTEIPDRFVTLPYQGLQAMRDAACLYALDQGFEWVMLIENDALPEKDLVIRLIKWNMPVVVPYIWEDEMEKVLAGPQYKRNMGLRPIQWAVFTCLLIRCRVLNCFPSCMPFGTSNIEAGFYYKLAHYGHQAWQDTDTELKIATRPTYPGAKESMDDFWDFLREADLRRRQEPDRKPIDPNDVREMYWPEGWADWPIETLENGK